MYSMSSFQFNFVLFIFYMQLLIIILKVLFDFDKSFLITYF